MFISSQGAGATGPKSVGNGPAAEVSVTGRARGGVYPGAAGGGDQRGRDAAATRLVAAGGGGGGVGREGGNEDKSGPPGRAGGALGKPGEDMAHNVPQRFG
ncbi:MAG: hypothetical protein KA712_09675 [Myxococcales bacterium]|nr:hypothetical protein [Myxococcales bacterium]